MRLGHRKNSIAIFCIVLIIKNIYITALIMLTNVHFSLLACLWYTRFVYTMFCFGNCHMAVEVGVNQRERAKNVRGRALRNITENPKAPNPEFSKSNLQPSKYWSDALLQVTGLVASWTILLGYCAFQ